jgi:Cu+-exporting ATPase
MHRHHEHSAMSSNSIAEMKWTVEGMSCTSCATTVTKFLEKRGFKNVLVDYASGEVRFETQVPLNREEVIRGIESLGYHVVQKEKESAGHPFFLSTLEGKFFFCLVFTIPLLLHMVLPFHFLHQPLFQLALCVPVFVVGLGQFGKSAWGSVREGVPNMDVLICIGSTAAFIYSLIGAVFLNNADYLFFETGASIITLVLLGNVIEKRSVKKTRTAIEALDRLQPQKAKRIDFFGSAFEVVSEVPQPVIKPGEYFLVNTGDRVPADGDVVWGEGLVNESMITGESLPLEKKPGARLIGGTILENGSLKMRADAVGKNTVLSNIIEMVAKAQQNRPSIQRLADRITAIFVPAVLGIAALTFLLAYFVFDTSLQNAIMNSIGVLVIACPCAMGLATPTAVMVGIGLAAQRGILIKGAQTLETFASIKTVVFDKTGTLTTGKFKISQLQAAGVTEEELKSILAGLEKHSSHPVAVSITAELQSAQPVSLLNVTEVKGISVQGTDASGNIYQAGSARILSSPPEGNQWNVFVTRNNELIGQIALTDQIRPEAKETIQSLHAAGIKTVMLSGDRIETCALVAAELGIDVFYAEVLPAEKLRLIEALRKQGTVSMAGDGINDAPALAAATVGVSLSGATQVAIDSAQIILLQNNLKLLPEALRISQATLKTIRQNLFWAFFYNTLAIPVAAVGLLKPVVAALSMAFSDVIVIGNSLRLRFKTR